MKMKTYQADTMQEALALVKDEMGPDAVILKSRRTTRKLLGKTKACFEVTAALEESLFARPAPVVPDRQTARETAAPRMASRTPGRPGMPGQDASRDRASAAPGMYDWRGSLRRVDGDGNDASSGNANAGSGRDPREYNVQEPARRQSQQDAGTT
jgi:flagellar biosynthesis protein FlhF